MSFHDFFKVFHRFRPQIRILHVQLYRIHPRNHRKWSKPIKFNSRLKQSVSLKKSSLKRLVFPRLTSDFDLRFGFCTANCIGFTPGTIGNDPIHENKKSVSLKKSSLTNLAFLGLLKVLEGLGSSGRLVARIST